MKKKRINKYEKIKKRVFTELKKRKKKIEKKRVEEKEKIVKKLYPRASAKKRKDFVKRLKLEHLSFIMMGRKKRKERMKVEYIKRGKNKGKYRIIRGKDKGKIITKRKLKRILEKYRHEKFNEMLARISGIPIEKIEEYEKMGIKVGAYIDKYGGL